MIWKWHFYGILFFNAHLHYIHYNIINIILTNQNAMLIRIKHWFTIYDFNQILQNTFLQKLNNDAILRTCDFEYLVWTNLMFVVLLELPLNILINLILILIFNTIIIYKRWKIFPTYIPPYINSNFFFHIYEISSLVRIAKNLQQ